VKKILILCLFLGACSQDISSEEPFGETASKVEFLGVTTTTTSTTTTSTTTTSTTTTSTTTTSTTTLNIPDSATYAVAPTISIYNCPDEIVSMQEFEVSWEMFAGSSDVDYFRMSIWKNGDYLSRVYYEKETLPEAFPYPLANTSRPMTVTIINEFEEEDGETNTYVFYLTVSDSEFPFGEEISCSITFQN
jgi:hypothetical protein